ncbi:MAG: DUF262 domain-containing HNH endonuclease family protein [Bacteroidales bacterium]|jgi:uncharacterized protein with ParB-like and HNH nuclease domain|nr:DUF262 domain-containing HNH endonuclease family protein [Bacteroidales bacterium]
MAVAFKTLQEYLYQNGKQFVVPNYQRGYKWAVKEDNMRSEVEKLMDNLINAFKSNIPSYFLQGVTVCEEDNNIVLIDGQQRTTTLYLLLWCIGKEKIKDIDLQYKIRQKSEEFIKKLKDNNFDYTEFDKDNLVQDIFYFKKAIEQIQEKLTKIDNKDAFCKYILDNVQILYIVIDKDKATKTFTMMNGSKATMLQEELIKAEMLRLVSVPDKENKEVSTSVDENLDELKEIIAKDWETNALRSRYAREWDKWLYWWNREDVKEFFNAETPMGLLLEYYYKRDYYKRAKNDKSAFNFDNFRPLITDKKKTKDVFKGLRDLQKSFEDIFNTPKIFNALGLVLYAEGIRNAEDKKFETINYFIENKKDTTILADYAKWRLVGATHRQITKANDLREDEETKENKAENALYQLSQKFVYQNAYEFAAKQLLRLNVEEDNKLNNGKGRKFDFSIYANGKSLEHIHPKSKAYHSETQKNDNGEEIKLIYKDGIDNFLEKKPDGKGWLNRDDLTDCTEHSIGNLLLLDKNENSKFNNSDFETKKGYYFDTRTAFKSRNLLHTIAVFANSNWGKGEIENNQKDFIERFEKDYEIKEGNNGQ